MINVFEHVSKKNSKYSKALKTSIVSVGAQVINIVTAFISVPLIINAVGVERYGLWATLTSAFSFLSFSDFGLGIGMQNRISTRIVNGNRYDVNSIFVSSFYMALFIAIIILCGMINMIDDISVLVTNLIKYDDVSINEDIVPTILSVFVIVGLGIVSGIIQRTFDAFQEGYFYRYMNIFSRIVSLFLLYLGVRCNFSLAHLLFVFNGVPCICTFFLLVICFKKYALTLNLKYFNLNELVLVFKVGILGLGAGISIFLISQLTPLLISLFFGLNQVAAYSVVMRILNMVILFYTLIILPFWPAITDAYAKKEIRWIKYTLGKMRLYVFSSAVVVLSLLGFVIVPFVMWWTGGDIIPSMELIISCIIFVGLYVWNTQISVFLNATSHFKGQATYGIVLSLLSIYIVYILREVLSESLVIMIVSVGLFLRNVCMEFEVKYKLLKNYGK